MLTDLLNPEKALIFRIVHKGNIEQILQTGCPSRNTAIQQDGYIEIGNKELIQRRINREVPCPPGGVLSDYVPFYFTPFSPMLYNIKTGYGGVPKRPLSDIVILVSSLHHLKKHDVPFVFSDRHAYLKTAQFSNTMQNLDWIIWTALQERNFKKDDAEKFEKYQAETLVYKHVSMDALLGIACYNPNARDYVQQLASQYKVNVCIFSQNKWFL